MSSEEIKEILEKQVQRFSEASEKTGFPSDLRRLLTVSLFSTVQSSSNAIKCRAKEEGKHDAKRKERPGEL